MILSDKASSLIVTGHSARFADRCATAIADLSLRECGYLDELYLLNAPGISDPLRKRRHRQFLCELVNTAVRQALAEDAEDLKSFRGRAREQRMSFEDLVRDMKRPGTL